MTNNQANQPEQLSPDEIKRLKQLVKAQKTATHPTLIAFALYVLFFFLPITFFLAFFLRTPHRWWLLLAELLTIPILFIVAYVVVSLMGESAVFSLF